MVYRLLFKNHADEIYGTDSIEAHDDRSAVEKAKRIFRCGIGAGYEIWRNGELIHTEPPKP